MKLYEIIPRYKYLLTDYWEAETEEDAQKALDALEEVDAAFEEKIETLVKAWKNEESDLPGIKNEMDRLKSMYDMKKSRIDGIKNLIKVALSSVKKADPRLKLDIGTVRVQKNSRASVNFEGDAEQLPEEYRRTIPVSYECDKDALEKRYKAFEKMMEGILATDPGADIDALAAEWRKNNNIPDDVTIKRDSHVRLG